MTIEQLTQQFTDQLRERDAVIVQRDAALVQRDAQIVQRDAALVQRDATLTHRDAVIAELTETVGKLNGELEWCKRQLFGRKSERYEDPNQPTLFTGPADGGEPDAVQSATPPPAPPGATVTVGAHARREGGRGKRQPIPDHLRREPIIHDLPEDQRIDPATDAPLLVKIGEEVSEKLAFKPGEIYVERHIRIKYRRMGYENLSGDASGGGASGGGGPEVITAPPPVEGLSKCLAAPSLLAEIAVRKYADHVPLDRLVKIFRRHGVELSKASMCRWMQGVGELIEPLLTLMKERMIEHSRIIQHDDTPVRQQAPGTGRCDTCRFWPAVGQPGTQGHYVIFDYTQTRQRAGPQQWFRDHHDKPLFVGGELQCDAFAGYGGLLDAQGPWRMTHVGCWAHARRKFHDARLNAPGPACHALGSIRGLYDIEARIKDASQEHRVQVRQAEARPKVDAFFDWCDDQKTQTLPQSAIGQAVTYALNQQTSLRRYLDAAYRQIDNNACERTLRGLAIGRKNWLFTGSPAGGLAAARLFSLIGSAQLHHLEPLAYLHDLIRHLPATPITQLDTFLPDHWSPSISNT